MLAMRALIIAVLLVSGIAKLFDREGSEEAIIGFRVPLPLVSMTTIGLPWLEIALAIGLVFGETVGVAAALASLLFLAFTIGVSRVAARGENLDCHCFGQLSSGPVTWLTALRNACLTILASTVFWYAVARESTPFWELMTWAAAGAGVITIAFAAMVWAILRLWQNQIELLERIDELQALIPAGKVARPPIEESFAGVTADMVVTNPAGELVPVPGLHKKNTPTLLVFLSESCRSCAALLPDIALWQQEFAGLMRITVIGSGDGDVFARSAADAGISDVHLQENSALPAVFGVKANPTTVLIDHDGYVRSKPALGGVAIRRMINELRAQAGQ